MQNKPRIFIALSLLIGLVQLSAASTKNDVVKITLPNKAAVEIKGEDIYKHNVDTACIAQNINRFFRYYQTSNLSEIMKQSSTSFTIKEMDGQILSSTSTNSSVRESSHQLLINNKEVEEQIISSENFDANIYYLQKHQLQFSNKTYTYILKFDTIEQLHQIIDDELLGVLNQLMADIKNNKDQDYGGKHIAKLHYSVSDDNSYKRQYEANKYPGDQIILSGNTGLESVKNAWVASFELAMGLSFNKKGIRKNTYNIYYEWQYDFSNPDKRNINQFASIGYRRDFSKDPDKTNAYTFKLGYLTNKQGNMYEDNTLKFGVRKSLSKHIYIEPQIYFTEFFQDVMPSIKVGFSF
ncbi:hypothetical protein [Saccharicrinis aurantiacus]|uniref:hypothetical protein n=1 Tax=Saccharicrinis aurantiacus TaxID=1849719 RepID=UPI00094F657B|nr:hypothetical protein [Saccharicrinis aurantiacus]